MKRKLRIGSRESKLAIIQAHIVIESIKKYDSDIEPTLVTMKTTGDKILNNTLDKIGGKGLFIKELERALLECEADICVHSFKDMPMELDTSLPVVGIGKREDPRDVLILPEGGNINEFMTGNIGTSSKRRIVQLNKLYDDITVNPIRGNVLTRIERLDKREFDALVLAYAGIKRLGLGKRASKIFTVNEIVPAACQGIIAVQGRKGECFDFLRLFNNPDSEYLSASEREFVKTLNCGCSSPVGAYASIHGNELKLTGIYLDEKTGVLHKESISGEKIQAQKLGETLAKRIGGK